MEALLLQVLKLATVTMLLLLMMMLLMLLLRCMPEPATSCFFSHSLQLVPTPNHSAVDIEDFRNRSGKLVKQWLEQQQQQEQHVCSLPASLTHIDLSYSSCDNNCIAVIRFASQTPHMT